MIRNGNESKKEKLMKIADSHGIEIMDIECKKCGSMSVLEGDNCYIGMDMDLSEDERSEKMAHELGHCVKGAFYNRYSSCDTVSRYEAIADKWAVENLIPKKELIRAFKMQINNIYLLAEHFGVSENFMIKACKQYGFYHEAM